ncbi:MAG: glutamyl-tRNA reductase [Deltaproteobacteria bacterium]|nr:glutamyl-tRNA reductase [Deltaproteobacteria bacterium]
MSLIIVGISHKTANLALREQFALSDERQIQLLQRLSSLSAVEECVLVSTCNRLEVYAFASAEDKALQQIKICLKEIPNSADFDEDIIYSFNQGDAFLHGFRVVSGLDSMVLGENQILSQMKESFRQAEQEGSLGTSLNKYFQRCFNVSKKIRHETQLGAHPVSVSYVAILLAKKIFGSLENRKALLLGAGKMSELALQNLKSQGCSEILISNRNIEKAKALASQIAAQVVPFEDYLGSLSEVDVVITSTGAQEPILKVQAVQESMKLRKNKALFIIDIALPRNVEEGVNDLYNVYLYNLDDLQKVVDQNLKERQKEALKAEQILIHEVQLFKEEEKHRSLSPTIAKLTQKFNQIREKELEKLVLQLAPLSSEQQQKIRACTQAMVSKMLHDPLLVLKTEQQEPSSLYQDILKKLFRLEDESDLDN